MHKKSLLSLAIAASFAFSPLAHAAATKVELATGDEKLSYHNVHGKALQEKLKKYNLNVTLLPTKGSTDNILKIENGIVDMALAQEDVYAMASVKDPELAKKVGVYGQLDYECVIGVVGTGVAYDQLSKVPEKAAFGVGGEGSGSKVTLDFLAKNSEFFQKIAQQPDNSITGLSKIQSGAYAGILTITKIDEKNELLMAVAKQYAASTPLFKFLQIDDPKLAEVKIPGVDRNLYRFMQVNVPVPGTQKTVTFPTVCVSTVLLVNEKKMPKEAKDSLAKAMLGLEPPKSKMGEWIEKPGEWLKKIQSAVPK